MGAGAPMAMVAGMEFAIARPTKRETIIRKVKYMFEDRGEGLVL